MAEEQHELLRIRGRQRKEGSVRQKDAISNYGVAVWVPIGVLIAVGVNTAEDAGHRARVPGQGLHHLSNGCIGARTQESEETTIEAKVLPQVAAIQESMDNLADNRPPEAMFIGEAIVVHTLELVEVVFDQSVERRGFGVAWKVDRYAIQSSECSTDSLLWTRMDY
jgi:hypothetical protein